jgi:iron complex transport system substrate-binding protein
VDLIGPRHLLAVTQFADDPAFSNVAQYVAEVPHRVASLRVEQILSWQPSAAVASEFNAPGVLQQLEQEQIPVLRLADPTSLDEIRANIEAVAAFCGAPSDRLLQRMTREQQALEREPMAHQQAQRPRVLLWLGGSTGGYTAGAGTLFDELVRRAGAQNVAAEYGLQGHAALGVERALALDPDVVVQVDAEIDRHARPLFSTHRTRKPQPYRDRCAPTVSVDPVWKLTRAGDAGHLRTVPARHVLSTSHYALHLARDLRQVIDDVAMHDVALP